MIKKGKTLMLILASLLFLGSACSSTSSPGGPQLGAAGLGSPIDKSGDATLQAMINDVAPKFKQHKFVNGDLGLNYNLFTPAKLDSGKRYPLVVFIADASTPGTDIMSPLRQGYGGLIWATKEDQEKNPCFVLVPQFSGIAVNDLFEHTSEADAAINLINDLAKNNPIDPSRIYITGQSMGGMLAMYYNIAYPQIFAASLYVDCHWDNSKLGAIVKHPLIFVGAGEETKSGKTRLALEEAARQNNISYAWAEWSARLPLNTQDDLAANLLGKGNPVNLITFEPGTVLPENVQGSEHMYSFDYAYKLTPVREWLFKQTLK